MYSKIVKKLPIQWGKEIVIKQLIADPAVVESIKETLMKRSADSTEENINKELHKIIMRDNYFNCLMDEVNQSYKIEFSDKDAEIIKAKIKKNDVNNSFSEAKVNQLTKTAIIKELIYNDLAEYWGISMTDSFVKNTLKEYNLSTNESIENFLNDREKFEDIKKTLLEQVISERLLNAFKPRFDLEEFNKQINNKNLNK